MLNLGRVWAHFLLALGRNVSEATESVPLTSLPHPEDSETAH